MSGCNTAVAVVTLAGLTLGVALPANGSTGAEASRGGVRVVSISRERKSTYADGRYRATGTYGNLPSSVGVSIRLRDDVVRSVKVTPHATDPTSLRLQRRFARAVPAVVVGKYLDDVHVSRLAGSSGTPVGFNNAIERIKREARR